jgi:hypothetical protein
LHHHGGKLAQHEQQNDKGDQEQRSTVERSGDRELTHGGRQGISARLKGCSARGYHTRITRPPRWSKKTDELVRHVALRSRPSLQAELGRWLEDSSRFRTFVTANQDKIRKKLNTADDEESRLDVRCELLVAYRLLLDRRFELAFEAYGARQLGPDFTLTFRANQRFNLEVTRLRATTDAVEARLANVIAGKLRQLPGNLPNALLVATSVTDASLEAATRLLKSHADQKDDAFFARRGLETARDFYAHYLHLGGIFVLDEAAVPPHAIFRANREARHPLPREVVTALTARLSSS